MSCTRSRSTGGSTLVIPVTSHRSIQKEWMFGTCQICGLIPARTHHHFLDKLDKHHALERFS